MGERSILKVYALSNNGTKTDTLKNISEPGILLHRQKRVLEYNKDFMMGDKLDFQVVTKPEDSGKVFVDKSQISGYRAVLVDTSVTSGGWTGLVYEFLGSQLIRCVGVEGETRRLGMVDVEDGVYEVWCDGIVGIAMETDDKKWLLEKDRKKVEIKLPSKGNVVIYSARNKSKQLFPIPPGLIKFKKDGDAYVIKWQDYEDHFLKNDSIYATVDKGEYGEFEIVAQYKSTNQEHTKEKAIILGVPKIESIEILSDHMDDEGKNLLRFEPNSFYGIGKQIIGPEWYYDGTTIPTSHTRSTYLRLRIKIIVPLNGQYEVEGLSADTFLSFSKKVFLLKTGLNEFDIQGDNLLPNFPHKIESETEWIIASKMYNGKKQIIKKIISNFILYLTYNKPLTVNSGNYKTNITSKRMDLATLMLAGVTDTTVAASAVRDLLDIRLQNFFRQPVLKNNELWRIWDYEELYPIPFIPPKEMRGVQCGQGALMAELILGILGLYAEYTHLQPSKEYIRFSSLSNPDDSLICNRPPHTSCQVDHLHEEILLYYFSGFINPWQKGEGAIYYNNTIYTMFTNGVDGFGSSKKAACRNAMENLEAKNTDIIKKLQRWFLLYKNGTGQNCILNGTVDIPTRLDK